MGNLGNGGFNWKSSIHGGFSIATFDYRRLTVDMSPFLRGKSSNSGPCSLAMLNCGRMVTLMVWRYLKFILTAHMFDGIEMDLNSFPFLWPFPNSYLLASHFLVSTKGKKRFWAILGNQSSLVSTEPRPWWQDLCRGRWEGNGFGIGCPWLGEKQRDFWGKSTF